MIDGGASQRAAILLQAAERFILEPLKTHGWQTEVKPSARVGEGMVIRASRAGTTHSVALLYSGYTDNSYYKALTLQVERIYYQGDAADVSQYTRGVTVPVGPASAFGTELIRWNSETTEGRFSPVDDSNAHQASIAPPVRRLLSEDPIDAIWLRIRQFQSLTLARKLVLYRAGVAKVSLSDEQVSAKAQGIAFTLRNAADYFTARDLPNVSQRVLNYYYGTMSFAAAEMLALPEGATDLSEIERVTVQGHGLYTVDGQADAIDSLIVGGNSNGFFPAWLRTIGAGTPGFPQRKARKFDEVTALPADAWITVEHLFASIPELADLYGEIFAGKPRWIKAHYDANLNMALRGLEKTRQSYIKLIDLSARMEKEDLTWLPGPISEISAVSSEQWGRHFRARVDHPGHEFWHGALNLHSSPFERNALIEPIFGSVDKFRAVCLTLLYALSIVVRYRPSLWRRVQEGDLDHLRALIEAFLSVAGRVLPEEFLAAITGQPVHVHQPGSFYS